MKRKLLLSAAAVLAVAGPLSLGAQTLTVGPLQSGVNQTVSGTGSGASAPVEVFVDGVSAGQGAADGAGAFSVTGVTLPVGSAVTAQNQESWYFSTPGNNEGFADNSNGGLGGTESVAGGVLTYTVADSTQNPSVFKVTSGHPTSTLKVLEMRLRNPGTMNQINITLNDTILQPVIPFQPLAAQTDFITYQVPLVTNNVNSSGLPTGTTNFWLYLQFLNTTNGDLIEFDYIRVREYFDWHFDNDGDLMSNFATGGTVTVAGGVATMTNTVGGANAFLETSIFAGMDTSIFNTLQTAIDANPTIQPGNLLTLNYFGGGPGYAFSGFGNALGWAVTPGTFVVSVQDLTQAAQFGNNWTSGLASLNYPGGWFSPMFPQNAGEVANVDYVRIRPAVFNGPSAAATVPPQAFVWSGAIDTDFQVAGNWTPSRDLIDDTDTLIFDGNVTAGPVTVTNLPAATQDIDALVLQNGITVNLETTTTTSPNSTLRLNAATDALDVCATCGLVFTGQQGILIRTGTGATGQVDGLVRFTSTAVGNGVAHRLIGGEPEAISFNSGSSFEFAPRGTGWGNPFSNVASVVFQSGSTYYQGGTAAGPSEGTGSNPFSSTPASVVFQPGSLFYNWTSVASTTGRTYGDLTMDNRGGAAFVGGANPWIVDGDLLYKGTMVSGMNLGATGGTADPVLAVSGDFIIEDGGKFVDGYTAAANELQVAGDLLWANTAGTNVSIAAGSTRTYHLNGTSAQQQVNSAGVFFQNLRITNPNGALVVGPVGVRTNLNLEAGDITVDAAGTLTLASGATVTGTGSIIGELTRQVDASALASHAFPVEDNPVSIEITAAGTGAGTIAVGTSAGAGASLPGGATGITRTWSITPTGISGFTATVVFTYSDAELNGATETNLEAVRWDGSQWVSATTTIDTVANTATVTGVTDFSDWTLIDPGTSVDSWMLIVE